MPELAIPSLDQEQIGLLTIAVSVLLAAISFVIRNVQSERARVLASREAFLSDQLRLLSGPLYAMSKANDAAYHAFRSTFAHAGRVHDPIADLAAEDRGTWMLWTKTVFQPANLGRQTTMVRILLSLGLTTVKLQEACRLFSRQAAFCAVARAAFPSAQF